MERTDNEPPAHYTRQQPILFSRDLFFRQQKPFVHLLPFAGVLELQVVAHPGASDHECTRHHHDHGVYSLSAALQEHAHNCQQTFLLVHALLAFVLLPIAARRWMENYDTEQIVHYQGVHPNSHRPAATIHQTRANGERMVEDLAVALSK